MEESAFDQFSTWYSWSFQSTWWLIGAWESLVYITHLGDLLVSLFSHKYANICMLIIFIYIYMYIYIYETLTSSELQICTFQWHDLEDPWASQIQHVHIWTQHFFFLHSQIGSSSSPLSQLMVSTSTQAVKSNSWTLPAPWSQIVSDRALLEYLANIPQLCPFLAALGALLPFKFFSTPLLQVPAKRPPRHQHCLLVLPHIILHTPVTLNHL